MKNWNKILIVVVSLMLIISLFFVLDKYNKSGEKTLNEVLYENMKKTEDMNDSSDIEILKINRDEELSAVFFKIGNRCYFTNVGNDFDIDTIEIISSIERGINHSYSRIDKKLYAVVYGLDLEDLSKVILMVKGEKIEFQIDNTEYYYAYMEIDDVDDWNQTLTEIH